jgi:hypothetical protein
VGIVIEWLTPDSKLGNAERENRLRLDREFSSAFATKRSWIGKVIEESLTGFRVRFLDSPNSRDGPVISFSPMVERKEVEDDTAFLL